jgi:hypothetical protein
MFGVGHANGAFSRGAKPFDRVVIGVEVSQAINLPLF